jgi:hypothetical protein
LLRAPGDVCHLASKLHPKAGTAGTAESYATPRPHHGAVRHRNTVNRDKAVTEQHYEVIAGCVSPQREVLPSDLGAIRRIDDLALGRTPEDDHHDGIGEVLLLSGERPHEMCDGDGHGVALA